MNSHDAHDPSRFLEELVRIPSPSGEEGRAVAWLVSRMRELGYDEAGADGAGNAVGVIGGGERTLVLLGHIDTVPGTIPVRRAGDTLYGRGTVDAKGPLTAFTLAAAAAGRRPGWRIVVAGAVEEETPTSRGARALAGAFSPTACVIGEPGGWQRLGVGYKGRLVGEYRLERPVAHTAGRETGACDIAVRFWNRIVARARDYNLGRERLFDQVTPFLRSFNSRQDGLAETVEMSLSLRLPEGVPPAEAETWITSAAEGGEVAFTGSEPAFRAGKSNALVQAFLGAIRATQGAPTFVVKTGTSDMNVVGPIWRCPILAYGPGDSALDHTPDEHIDSRELATSIEVLRQAIVAFTGGHDQDTD